MSKENTKSDHNERKTNQELIAKFSQRLKEISELEEGWFHDSGSPISKEALANAEKIIQIILNQNDESFKDLLIYPQTDGGILIEWMNKEAEVFLYSEGSIQVYNFSEAFDNDENAEELFPPNTETSLIVESLTRQPQTSIIETEPKLEDSFYIKVTVRKEESNEIEDWEADPKDFIDYLKENYLIETSKGLDKYNKHASQQIVKIEEVEL